MYNVTDVQMHIIAQNGLSTTVSRQQTDGLTTVYYPPDVSQITDQWTVCVSNGLCTNVPHAFRILARVRTCWTQTSHMFRHRCKRVCQKPNSVWPSWISNHVFVMHLDMILWLWSLQELTNGVAWIINQNVSVIIGFLCYHVDMGVGVMLLDCSGAVR